MKEDILIKYLNNSCTDEEFEEFVGWVKKEARKQEDKNWSLEQWKIFEPELQDINKKKYSALLDKIHHEINLQNNKDTKDNKTISFSKVAMWLSRAAAILFLPLVGVLFYLLTNNHSPKNEIAEVRVDSLEVIAPIGSRTVVQLSDGTEVNLNYGSRIKYPRDFIGKTREVKLSGEAYFDVAHNPEKPFIVKTGNLNVKALGTEFNVQSYPEDEMIATTLVKGKVVLEKMLPGETKKQITTMIPGQHVTYSRNSGEMTSSMENMEKYIAWKDGKLIFDNDPITEVAEKLGRMFNVEIEVADNAKYLSFTVTISNDPLYLILDLMSETIPVSYKILPRKKQPDGSFSKQKIRIVKR